MPPRLWQRQPGETPADFMAFVAYLRLKGRRSHHPVAALYREQYRQALILAVGPLGPGPWSDIAQKRAS
jgi:hypothetical protein